MSTGFKSGSDLSKLSNSELRKRFAADTGESTTYDSIPYGTMRAPTSRGLFGSKIDDRELLFAVQREPAAFRIVFGVAKDTLDNWFTIVPTEGDDDGSLNEEVQAELDRLQAKTKLIKLLSLSRLFGYSLLLLGYDDKLPDLKNPMEQPDAQIRYIEPYSKLEINRIEDVADPDDDRDGYPQFYYMRKSAGFTDTNIQVHYSRAILCSTLLPHHRYKGWSVLQCLYDDITGYRYMRWGIYMAMIRYGSGFPDVTLKGPEADQAAIDAFIASGQFDNLNCMKYFVHNEQQALEFKGFASSSLNPLNYYQIALETLSLGSGIPEPVLKGAQAGAITGSEINERSYFKVISDEQTAFEQVLRLLIDKILSYLGKATEDQHLNYKIVWKPSYEPTQKEKAELDYINAQTAEKELLCKTVDEVRKGRFKLKPLPNNAGEVCLGLTSSLKEMGASLSLSKPSEPVVAPPLKIEASTSTVASKENLQSPSPALGDGNPAKESKKGSSADQSPLDAVPVDKSISRTLPHLIQDIGVAVMNGKLGKEEAMQRGKNLIVEYTRLEQEHALLWIKHRSGFPGVVIIPPEMQRKLDSQHKRFLKDLDTVLSDAEKVYKAGSTKL